MSKAGNGKQDIYQDIRRKIIRLEFPPGCDLDEVRLVERYGVSRTPIRETLIRLAGEGLVTIKRNRGAYVSPLDIASLQAYFEAAEFITAAVVRLAAIRRTKEELADIHAAMLAFEDAMARADAIGMVENNDRFHTSIGTAAHNKYLFDSYRRILADHERISQLCFEHEIATDDAAVKAITLQQHQAIHAAIAGQDPATAERVSREHIALCKTGLQEILARPSHALEGLTLEPAG